MKRGGEGLALDSIKLINGENSISLKGEEKIGFGRKGSVEKKA